jgi:hypothetical protein
VSPTLIYDAQRTIERTAQDLGPKIVTYVDRSTPEGASFVAAWEAWDAQWQPFYAKYQTLEGKAGAIADTDNLNRRTEEFRSQLIDLQRRYQTMKQPGGAPVPAPGAPPPTPAQDQPAQGSWLDSLLGQKPGSGVPWWVWMLGGAALVGGGYLAYQHYQEAQRKKRVLEREVLPALLPAGLARAAAQHDAPRSMTGIKTLADYAREADDELPETQPAPGRAESIVYRPYDHPHLLRLDQATRRDRDGDRALEERWEQERDPYDDWDAGDWTTTRGRR